MCFLLAEWLTSGRFFYLLFVRKETRERERRTGRWKGPLFDLAEIDGESLSLHVPDRR